MLTAPLARAGYAEGEGLTGRAAGVVTGRDGNRSRARLIRGRIDRERASGIVRAAERERTGRQHCGV